MSRSRALGALVALAAALVPGLLPVAAQRPELHGERDVFTAPGVVVAWAILRGATEETTQVVLRLAATGDTYRHVAVEGVDPFSRERKTIKAGAPLTGVVDVRSPRASFADLPRREIQLYRTESDWRRGAPALTIYYLGLPDTTPELTSEAALSAYLDDAVSRARR